MGCGENEWLSVLSIHLIHWRTLPPAASKMKRLRLCPGAVCASLHSRPTPRTISARCCCRRWGGWGQRVFSLCRRAGQDVRVTIADWPADSRPFLQLGCEPNQSAAGDETDKTSRRRFRNAVFCESYSSDDCIVASDSVEEIQPAERQQHPQHLYRVLVAVVFTQIPQHQLCRNLPPRTNCHSPPYWGRAF